MHRSIKINMFCTWSRNCYIGMRFKESTQYVNVCHLAHVVGSWTINVSKRSINNEFLMKGWKIGQDLISYNTKLFGTMRFGVLDAIV